MKRHGPEEFDDDPPLFSGKALQAATIYSKVAGEPVRLEPILPREPRFDGATYEPEKDSARLTKQMDNVRALLSDGKPRTAEEIADAIGLPATSVPSIGARCRDLRKARWGSHTIVCRPRAGSPRGCFEYQWLMRANAESERASSTGSA